MKRVDIFGGVERFGNHIRIDLLGQGKLNENAIHSVVRVEVLDDVEQVRFGGRLGKHEFAGVHADPGARALFPLDVGATRWIVSDQDDDEARRTPPVGNEGLDFFRHLVAQRVRDFESVHHDSIDAARRAVVFVVRHDSLPLGCGWVS